MPLYGVYLYLLINIILKSSFYLAHSVKSSHGDTTCYSVSIAWVPQIKTHNLGCLYKDVYITHYFKTSALRNTMTSSNESIFYVTGSLCGEFTGHRWIPSQRPVTRSLDVFLICAWTSGWVKQSRRRRFETPSRSLWRHCNETTSAKLSGSTELPILTDTYHTFR